MHKIIELNKRKYHFAQVTAEEQLDLYQEVGGKAVSKLRIVHAEKK